jgi:hypothetical protein
MNTNEPNLNNIDDYNGKANNTKRDTVNLIIAGLLLLGLILSFVKINYSNIDDYVGTTNNPGIDTSKAY